MPVVKYAKWRQVRIAPGVVRRELRTGKKGTGATIDSVSVWSESQHSKAEAATARARIEARAVAQGYVIVVENESTEDI